MVNMTMAAMMVMVVVLKVVMVVTFKVMVMVIGSWRSTCQLPTEVAGSKYTIAMEMMVVVG